MSIHVSVHDVAHMHDLEVKERANICDFFSEVTWQAQNIALIVTGQLSNVMMIDNVKTIQTNSFYGDRS